MGGGGPAGQWVLNPLGARVRPVLPCDLCEVVRIEGVPNPGQGIKVPLLAPGRPEQGRPPDMLEVTEIEAAPHTSEYTCEIPAGASTRDRMVEQAKDLICRWALHEVNTDIVGALHEVAAAPHSPRHELAAGEPWGAGEYLAAASRVAELDPALQFPQEVVAVVPPARLAALLSGRHDKSVTYWGNARSCTSVSGLDVVTYGARRLRRAGAAEHSLAQPPPESAGLSAGGLPAFALPRRGSLGLALSDIVVRVERVGDWLRLTASYAAGAAVLRPWSVVGMAPAPARGSS